MSIISSSNQRSFLSSARPIVTEKVLEYLAYKTTYENAGPKEDIPDFYERVMPELALELLSHMHYPTATMRY